MRAFTVKSSDLARCPHRILAVEHWREDGTCRCVECTGIAASWCPIHGDCTCPRDDDTGEIEWHWEAGYVSYAGHPAWSETALHVAHYDVECPLHGATTSHAE